MFFSKLCGYIRYNSSVFEIFHLLKERVCVVISHGLCMERGHFGVLSYYHVGTRDQTQDFMLVSKQLYKLSHLTSPHLCFKYLLAWP